MNPISAEYNNTSGMWHFNVSTTVTEENKPVWKKATLCQLYDPEHKLTYVKKGEKEHYKLGEGIHAIHVILDNSIANKPTLEANIGNYDTLFALEKADCSLEAPLQYAVYKGLNEMPKGIVHLTQRGADKINISYVDRSSEAEKRRIAFATMGIIFIMGSLFALGWKVAKNDLNLFSKVTSSHIEPSKNIEKIKE